MEPDFFIYPPPPPPPPRTYHFVVVTLSIEGVFVWTCVFQLINRSVRVHPMQQYPLGVSNGQHSHTLVVFLNCPVHFFSPYVPPEALYGPSPPPPCTPIVTNSVLASQYMWEWLLWDFAH